MEGEFRKKREDTLLKI